MKNQNVKNLQKSTVEKSRSNIWKDTTGTTTRSNIPQQNIKFYHSSNNSNEILLNRSNRESSLKKSLIRPEQEQQQQQPTCSKRLNVKPLINEEAHKCLHKRHNFDYNQFESSDSDTSLSDCTENNKKLCTCGICCKCKCKPKQTNIQSEVISSNSLIQCKTNIDPPTIGGQIDNSRNIPIIQHNLEIPVLEVQELINKPNYSNRIKCKFKTLNKNIKSLFNHGKSKLKKLVFLTVHILLILFGILLQVLCYMKYSFLNISKMKRFLLLFVCLIAFFLHYFTNLLSYCNISNAINRIIYNGDVFFRLQDLPGISCNDELKLFFVKTQNFDLVQVEYSVDDECSPLKSCFQVKHELLDDIQIIDANDNSGFLISKCSKLSYHTSEASTCSIVDKAFQKDLDFSKQTQNNIHDFILMIRKKFLCEIEENCGNIDKNVQKCINTHRLCKTKIPSGTTNYNINNQMLFDISHCSCDREFFNCLKSISSSSSDYIGKMYFNYLKIKCFHFEYRYKCKLFVANHCLYYGDAACHATLVENPQF